MFRSRIFDCDCWRAAEGEREEDCLPICKQVSINVDWDVLREAHLFYCVVLAAGVVVEFGGSEYEVVSDFAASLIVVCAKIALKLAVLGLARLPTCTNIANIELDLHESRPTSVEQ
jgi:hypothetical protein